MKLAALSPQACTDGFRRLRVTAKTRESSIITSFRLEAEDGAPLTPFQPGQFLVFRIPSVETKGHVLRNYSLSGSPTCPAPYRISVKREPSAGPGMPAGLSSGYLHDCVDVGDVLLAQGPRGDFVLNAASKRPVVLLSGGVGLTPLMSMLHALAVEGDRRVLFLHACVNGEVHALRDEILALAASRPGVKAHFCYRTPTAYDRAEGCFHSEGFVSRDLLQSLLPLDDYDFYLCGPPPFMHAMYHTLRDLGVPKDRIAYEFFGPATVLEPDAKPEVVVPKPHVAEAANGAMTVEFRKSGITAVWDGAAMSLLSFAENQGLAPEFSCRAGVCGTCKARIVAGEVTYFEDPLDDPGEDEVLLCCSRPKASVVLDL